MFFFGNGMTKKNPLRHPVEGKFFKTAFLHQPVPVLVSFFHFLSELVFLQQLVQLFL
jgi:hypothetical protein